MIFRLTLLLPLFVSSLFSNTLSQVDIVLYNRSFYSHPVVSVSSKQKLDKPDICMGPF